MAGAAAVLKRNLAKSSYPRKSKTTRRVTTATASLRMHGGAVIPNSTSQGRNQRTFNRGRH